MNRLDVSKNLVEFKKYLEDKSDLEYGELLYIAINSYKYLFKNYNHDENKNIYKPGLMEIITSRDNYFKSRYEITDKLVFEKMLKILGTNRTIETLMPYNINYLDIPANDGENKGKYINNLDIEFNYVKLDVKDEIDIILSKGGVKLLIEFIMVMANINNLYYIESN